VKSEARLPLIWSLSSTDSRGARTTLGDRNDEGRIRVVEQEPILDLLEGVWKVVDEGGAEGMPGQITWAIGDILREAGRITCDPPPGRLSEGSP
jgi:hypothetical protein